MTDKAMTSRERVRRAVNYQRPDRVPIDLGAIRASGIPAVLYKKLKERLGVRSPTRIFDSMQLLADVEPEVLDRLHVDVVPLDCGLCAWQLADVGDGVAKTLPAGTDVYFPPGTVITEEADGSWVHRNAAGQAFARMPEGGFYFDFIRPTMAGHIDPDAWQPADTVNEETLAAVQKRAEDLYDGTDKALLGWGASISLIGLSALLADNITQGSLDTWLTMLMVEKQAANDMMARSVEASIRCLELYHQAVGNRCVAWGVASDDAGTQRSELLSPDLFDEMIVPHYRRLCDWVHEHTSWKTYLHSCGSIHEYLDSWIDAGIDILNPVQISAANMDAERLMADFGGRIVFWGGGCDTQRVLPVGTPDQIRAHVRANLDAFAARDGGYVFTQVHNIQADVPVENVVAMLGAAYEYGA